MPALRFPGPRLTLPRGSLYMKMLILKGHYHPSTCQKKKKKSNYVKSIGIYNVHKQIYSISEELKFHEERDD